MQFEPLGDYEKIDQRNLGDDRAAAWLSQTSTDPCWDKFLQETSLGQYQQSSFWARAKKAEGWSPLRVVLTLEGRLAGGFQVLWRRSRWGRIGYVSKGPVIACAFRALANYATELLREVCQKERLTLLIVQPADLCVHMSEPLATRGFQHDVLSDFTTATWLVDLRGGFDAVEQGMSKWTRKKVRQAIKRGVTIREGRREDLSTFFELMLSTCRRQRVKPHPSDLESLVALWDAAKPENCIRLTLAEIEGRPLAGLVSIMFGAKVTLWKKGWIASDGQLHPNELLMYEAMKWSHSSGYLFCDFLALDRDIALALLRGEPLSPEQENSRHMFNIRLGGSPRLVPEVRVYFPNRFIRLAYRVICSQKIRGVEEDCKMVKELTESGVLSGVR